MILTAPEGIGDAGGLAAARLEDNLAGLFDHGRVQGRFPFGEFGNEIAGLVPLFRGKGFFPIGAVFPEITGIRLRRRPDDVDIIA